MLSAGDTLALEYHPVLPGFPPLLGRRAEEQVEQQEAGIRGFQRANEIERPAMNASVSIEPITATTPGSGARATLLASAESPLSITEESIQTNQLDVASTVALDIAASGRPRAALPSVSECVSENIPENAKDAAFLARYRAVLVSLWATVEERYQVTAEVFFARVAAVFRKLSDKETLTLGSENAEEITEAGAALPLIRKSAKQKETDWTEQITALRAGELCLALACEQGDEVAWLRFERDYRHGMQAAGRALTKDDAEAEDLTQFVFGELYGIRCDGDRRISKLQHYSGRGSLGGWLRAVMYQSFIDRKRQTARFEQVEEVSEFDRLVQRSQEVLNGQNGHHVALQAPIVQPDELEDTRLRQATEEAMRAAFDALEPKERLLLNYYFFDGLTLREIGLLLNVHEATISRWLAKAQKQVKKKTEEILQRRYQLRRAEVAECLALAARSEIDVRPLLVPATSVTAPRGA